MARPGMVSVPGPVAGPGPAAVGEDGGRWQRAAREKLSEMAVPVCVSAVPANDFPEASIIFGVEKLGNCPWEIVAGAWERRGRPVESIH